MKKRFGIEFFRRDPFRAEERDQIPRHLPLFDRRNRRAFQIPRERDERIVAVQLPAFFQRARPGEDRRDRVGGGLLAL